MRLSRQLRNIGKRKRAALKPKQVARDYTRADKVLNRAKDNRQLWAKYKSKYRAGIALMTADEIENLISELGE